MFAQVAGGMAPAALPSGASLSHPQGSGPQTAAGLCHERTKSPGGTGTSRAASSARMPAEKRATALCA